MATDVPEQLLKTEEKTIFSGSSEEDRACAKLFWQSLTLHPPIESRLVSGDVKQRLPVAGPGKQTKNYALRPKEPDPKLENFLQQAHAEIIYEESLKLTYKAIQRQETLYTFRQQQEERKMKEEISRRVRVPVEEEKFPDEDEEAEIQAAMADLDKFDQKLQESGKLSAD